MRSWNQWPKILARLLAGLTLTGIIFLTGCRDSLSLQAMDEPNLPYQPISSPAVATPTNSPGDDSSLRIKMLPGEGEWKFEATASDDTSYAIHVVDDHGRAVQTIQDIAARPPFITRDLLDIRDYNADGYRDILARTLPVGVSAIAGGVAVYFPPRNPKIY